MKHISSSWLSSIKSKLPLQTDSLRQRSESASRRRFLLLCASTPGIMGLSSCATFIPGKLPGRQKGFVHLIKRPHGVVEVIETDVSRPADSLPHDQKRCWIIDPRMFGDQCTIDIVNHKPRNKKIRIRNGLFPGIGLKANINITIDMEGDENDVAGNYWRMDFNLNGSRLAKCFPFDVWMRGENKIRCRLGYFSTSAIKDELREVGLRIKSGLEFSLDKEWHCSLQALNGDKTAICFETIGSFYYSDRLEGRIYVEDPISASEDIESADGLLKCPQWVRQDIIARTGLLVAELHNPRVGDKAQPNTSAPSISLKPERTIDHLFVHNKSYSAVASIITYDVNTNQVGDAQNLDDKTLSTDKREHVWVHCVSGLGHGFVRFTRHDEAWLTVLPISRWDAISVMNGTHTDYAFSAEMGKDMFSLDVPCGRVQFKRHEDYQKLWFQLSEENGDSFEFILSQCGADVALPEADFAHFTFGKNNGETASLTVLPDWFGGAPLTDGLLTGDSGQTWRTSVAKACLHVLRADGHVNLEFRFQHVEVESGKRNKVPLKLYALLNKDARISVGFSPQHLAERALYADKGATSEVELNPAGQMTNNIKPKSPEKPFTVLETRLSGNSRVVFKLRPLEIRIPKSDCLKPENIEKELTWTVLKLSDLLAWSHLELAVSPRALPSSASIEDQLNTICFKGSDGKEMCITERDDALNKINLTSGKLRDYARNNLLPPGAFETAIEIPYRLTLSPSKNARWRTSYLDMSSDAGFVPLWIADINTIQGDPSLRAIWSPDLEPNVLRDSGDQADIPTEEPIRPWSPGKGDAFRMSTSSNDRHQLVLASSCFGLPALMGLDENGKRKGETTMPPPVIKGFNFQLSTDGNDVEGLYAPGTIFPKKLALTSLGGFLDADGRWEPPASVKCLWPALTLERWRHQVILGRDIYVEVVKKGFLFPIGLRASYVKITERKFLKHPRFSYSIAVLVQRKFLRITRPEKAYPALNQQYQGRGWPIRNLTVLSLETPPLVDPDPGNLKTGSIKAKLGLKGTAFWPHTKEGDGADGLFRFKVQFDNDEKEIEMPLLFVDNTAAHNPDDVKIIVDYYNDDRCHDSPLRNISVPSIRRRYADSNKSGDTEFITKNWRLSAKSRTLPNPAAPVDSVYSMDSFMEGADQPPFYPFVDQARIQVQSIKSMTGSTTGIIQAQYHPLYLNYGFDAASEKLDGGVKNPAELFLGIVGKAPKLNFSQNGSVSGGLAKPNSVVVALSRSHGLIGGRPKLAGGSVNAKASKGGVKTTALASTKSDFSASFKDAEIGSFNPLESFIDAKFLGLDLADLLSTALFSTGAPKLVEEFLYDVSGDLRQKFVEPVQKILSRVVDELDKISSDDDRPLNWRSLYPGLSQRIDVVTATLARIDTLLKVETIDFERLQKAAAQFVSGGEGLLEELKRITRDPVPPIVNNKLKELRNMAALVQDLPRAFLGAAIVQIDQMLDDGEIEQTLKEEISALKAEVSNALGFEYHELAALIIDEVKKLEKNVASGINSGLGKYYTELRNEPLPQRNAEVVDYAFTALYGRPLGVIRKINQAALGKPPVYSEKRVYEPLFLEELGSPDFGTLGDSLYDDFIGESLVQFYNSVKQLDRMKQDALNQLCNTLLHGLEVATRMDEIRELSFALKDNFTQLCSEAIGPFVFYISKRGAHVATHLTKLDERLANIEKTFQKHQTVLDKYKNRYGGNAVDTLKTLSERVMQSRQRINEVVTELNYLRDKFSEHCEILTSGPTAKFGDEINRIMKLRRRALNEFRLLLGQLVESAAVFQNAEKQKSLVGASIAADVSSLQELKKIWSAIKDDVVETHKAVGVLVTDITTLDRINDAEEIAKNVQGVIKGKTETLRKYRNELNRFASVNPTTKKMALDILGELSEKDEAAILNGKILVGIDKVRQYSEDFERELAKLILKATLMAEGIRNEALHQTLKIVHPVALGLYAVHVFADYGLQLLSKKIAELGDSMTYLRLILSDSVVEQLDKLRNLDSAPGYHKFQRDLERVKCIVENATPGDTAPEGDIPEGWKDAIATARDLQNDWNDEKRGVGLLQVGGGISETIEALVAGDISELIDLDKIGKRLLTELEDKIKDALLKLVPTSLSLSYDWGTTIRPFPSSDPIFQMYPESSFWNTHPIFNKKNNKNHFLIDVKGSVDVATSDREMVVSSALRPFSIKLFPGFDALTINFKGALFESGPAGSDFDLKVDDVVIGEQLAYIKRLAEMLSPDNGPYLEFKGSPASVTAGFRLNIGSINFGVVGFLNIALDVACMLPLDDRRAMFRFGLSNRSKPFLISSPPYGGGGFVSVRMQAADLVGLSSGFEMGAVVDLSFGPLVGHGRVTSGVYIEKQAGRSIIVTGFVQAVGECSIACFGISASLGVSLTMIDENMYGDAWYEFSFKVGFFKVSYGFTVQYILKGGRNAPGGSSSFVSDSPILSKPHVSFIGVNPYKLYYAGNRPNDEKVERLKKICKTGEVKKTDEVIVACVHDRSDWQNHQKLFV